jgi:hypothetical protein
VPNSTGPIFVMGAQGSGTTLMRLILDSHDDLAMAQETGFARLIQANEYIPFHEFGDQWYGRIGLTQEQLERDLGQFYGGLFSRWAAEHGASRWGDKTPYHVWYMELLARVFPDAVFVGMVRHPGAGASSRTTRMGKSWASSLSHWSRRNKELLYQGARLGDRFVLCRYEDLVTSPEPLLRELAEWLGLPWSDRLLSFHEVHKQRGTASQVEGYTLSDQPLDPSRVDAWTRGIRPEHVEQLRKGRVRAMSRFVGYAPAKALPSKGWGDEHPSYLIDGDALSQRMKDRPGIDWERRPRRSLPNRELTLAELRRLRKRSRGGRRATKLDRLASRGRSTGSAALQHLPPTQRRAVRRVWWRIRGLASRALK